MFFKGTAYLQLNFILHSPTGHFDPVPLIISTTGPARLSLVFKQSKLKQATLQINEDIQWNSPRAYLVRALQGRKKTPSKKTTHHCKSAEDWNCMDLLGVFIEIAQICRCLRTQMSKFRQKLGFDNSRIQTNFKVDSYVEVETD